MKALLLVGDRDIQLLDVETPTPQSGQVLIKLKAAALNRRDQWIREGKYPNIKNQTILGSDGAGIVESCGEGLCLIRWVGQEVIINPNIDWGENPKIQSAEYSIIGMPGKRHFGGICNRRSRPDSS